MVTNGICEELTARFDRVCPPERRELRDWIIERVGQWNRSPDACFYQVRVGMVDPDEPSPPDVDFEVVGVIGAALVLTRAAPDGCSETIIPLRSLDRMRFIQKEGKTEIELRHGDCITWVVRLPEAQVCSDLPRFFSDLRSIWVQMSRS